MRVSRSYSLVILGALLALGACEKSTPPTEASAPNAAGLLGEDAAATAQVQVIHNAEDPRARVVDVYVNDALALDNFKYRRATAFLDLPTDLAVAVAPRNSKSVEDAIATFNFSLSAGESYVVVADGVLGGWRFEGNPEGIPIGFNLFPFAPARTAADDPTLVDLLAFHGSTDAPTVDVVARDVATLVDDVSYGSFQGYVSVPPAEYVLDVTTSDGTATVVSFGADLSGLAAGAATVVASGFLTPPPGPRFALLAVLPDGTVIKLPKLDDDEDDGDADD